MRIRGVSDQHEPRDTYPDCHRNPPGGFGVWGWASLVRGGLGCGFRQRWLLNPLPHSRRTRLRGARVTLHTTPRPPPRRCGCRFAVFQGWEFPPRRCRCRGFSVSGWGRSGRGSTHRRCWRWAGHGGLQTFHQKTTCTTRSTLGPSVVQFGHVTPRIMGERNLLAFKARRLLYHSSPGRE